MKPNTLNRLEKLEWSRGQKGSRIQCIVRVGVKPGRGQCDPQFYRDRLGNLWTRAKGEAAEKFRERVTAEAIARAQPKIAQIVGCETAEEAEEYARKA
jgi:hypothetical protein